MKLIVLAAGVVSLSLAGAACNTAREADAPDTRLDETTASTGAAGTAAPVADAGQAPAQEQLPDTASPLALIGGLGLLSLAGAAGLHLVRRR